MNLNDRELLELAAKAAGLKINQAFQGQRDAVMEPAKASLWIDGGSTAWNPLTDDGHALRLAMKLGICIQFIPECDTVQAYQERSTTGEPFNVHVAGLGDIETRRVITQAAAEIGKAMQEKH